MTDPANHPKPTPSNTNRPASGVRYFKTTDDGTLRQFWPIDPTESAEPDPADAAPLCHHGQTGDCADCDLDRIAAESIGPPPQIQTTADDGFDEALDRLIDGIRRAIEHPPHHPPSEARKPIQIDPNLRRELLRKTAAVDEYRQHTEDPRENGWIGTDGRP